MINLQPHQSSSAQTATRPVKVIESALSSDSISHCLAIRLHGNPVSDGPVPSGPGRTGSGRYLAKMMPHFTHASSPSGCSKPHLGQALMETELVLMTLL